MSIKVSPKDPIRLYETYAGMIGNNEEFEYSTHSYEIQEWRREEGKLKAEIYFMSEFVEQKSEEKKLKPWSEIKRVKELWENVPLTFTHPNVLPLQFSDDVIGLVKDVEEDEQNRRLKGTAEVPIEVPDWTDKTKEEWDIIIQQVQEYDEVSIGFWYQSDDSESGTFTNPDGQELEYNGIIRKPIPDHIAIVKGNPVCTKENGCGLEIHQLPNVVLSRVRTHLENHYEQLDRTAPWQRESYEDDSMKDENAISKLASCIETLTSKIYTQSEEQGLEKQETEEECECEDTKEEIMSEEAEEEEEEKEEKEETKKSETEEEETREEPEEPERPKDKELEDRVTELENELENVREREEELATELQSQLMEQVMERTEYEKQELEEKEIKDLEQILEVSNKVSTPQTEEGEMGTQSDNVNSPPGDSNSTGQVEVIDKYRERKESE